MQLLLLLLMFAPNAVVVCVNVSLAYVCFGYASLHNESEVNRKSLTFATHCWHFVVKISVKTKQFTRKCLKPINGQYDGAFDDRDDDDDDGQHCWRYYLNNIHR